MSWVAVDIAIGDAKWSGFRRSDQSGTVLSVPFNSGVKAGDVLTVGDKSFTAISVTNFNNRSEELLVETKESKNDKPTSRGSKRNTGGADVSNKAESGLDSETGEST
jgi:hypothetical protein